MSLIGSAIDAVAPWPLKILGGVKAGVSAAWSFAIRYPRETVIVVLLASCAWLYHGRSECHLSAESFKQSVIAAQAKADAQAGAERAKWDAQQKENADAADADHAALAASGADALRAYITAHRVQPGADQGAASKPVAATQGGDPAVPANATAVPIVAPLVVAEADLRTCDADYTYAKGAYDWAHGLNEDAAQ